MDRGFASWGFLDELSATQTPFVIRIKNNTRTELGHERYRVAWFCDLERRPTFNPGQVMTIKVDDTQVYSYPFPRIGQFQTIRLPLAAQPGPHQKIELAYRHSAASPPDPRSLAVLFEKLKVTASH